MEDPSQKYEILVRMEVTDKENVAKEYTYNIRPMEQGEDRLDVSWKLLSRNPWKLEDEDSGYEEGSQLD